MYPFIRVCIYIYLYINIFFVQVRGVKEVTVPFPLSDILLIIFALVGVAILFFYAWLQVLLLLVYSLLRYSSSTPGYRCSCY
jgi:hypothetical protein